jgi:hypothetical protein
MKTHVKKPSIQRDRKCCEQHPMALFLYNSKKTTTTTSTERYWGSDKREKKVQTFREIENDILARSEQLRYRR